ncbi:helix-turn-helix domain-containing protein [Myxococcus sp. CA040A]|uniref:helix-turn-helix domain-containing protein n=1 Tax=Myxococcus sp. CA040A TaxID=2741738 RepID=UPI00157A4FF5|nr:helix-turn-helix domain-containing protein [Myxococcus sp. CA040A]
MVNCDDSGSGKPSLRLVTKDTEAYWTTEDVAEFLRVSTKTVGRLRVKRGLPSVVLIDRTRRYSPAAIKAWVAAQEST